MMGLTGSQMIQTMAGLSLCIVGAGCAANDATVIDLRGSIERLREKFNADADKPRLVALFSPT